MTILGIDHIGIAVNNLSEAIDSYSLLGYKCVDNLIVFPQKKIQIQYMELDNLKIELITPLNYYVSSPVDRYIAMNKGYIMYHTCYSVDDIYSQINDLKKKKYSLIETPSESLAMNNRVACYLFNRKMGLVELVQD